MSESHDLLSQDSSRFIWRTQETAFPTQNYYTWLDSSRSMHMPRYSRLHNLARCKSAASFWPRNWRILAQNHPAIRIIRRRRGMEINYTNRCCARSCNFVYINFRLYARVWRYTDSFITDPHIYDFKLTVSNDPHVKLERWSEVELSMWKPCFFFLHLTKFLFSGKHGK